MKCHNETEMKMLDNSKAKQNFLNLSFILVEVRVPNSGAWHL